MNFFIINPNAGTNSTAKFQQLIALIKKEDNHTICNTTAPLEAFSFAQEAIKQGASRIIAVGGDGTINEVASALVGANIPLGIIPIGSGNGLARHLKIPLKINKALHLATHGKVNKIDVGVLNDKYFFCTAGIGFDASVANAFAKGKGRGLWNYIKATLKTIFKYQPINISLNEGPMESVFSLTFANANQFGNNAYISPLSNIQDGLLEIVKIDKIGIFHAFFIAIRLFNGNIHESIKVKIIATEAIQIKYKKNAPFHLDGESLFTETDHLSIHIKSKALDVIC